MNEILPSKDILANGFFLKKIQLHAISQVIHLSFDTQTESEGMERRFQANGN